MNSATLTLLAGLIVVIGRITQGKGMEARTVVGIVFAALCISLIGDADAELGNGFAALVLVAAIFTYGLPILKKLGYTA
jgi:uncharacterized membrane protein YjjB (DUF3815 family)